MSNEISDFTRFREGYEAGYYGKESEFPEDLTYMSGYDEGCEDDRFDMPYRYGIISSKPDIRPVRIEDLSR